MERRTRPRDAVRALVAAPVAAWALAAAWAPGTAAPSAPPAPAISRAQAVVDSLAEAERWDEVVAAARAALPGATDAAAEAALRSSLMLAHFHSGDLTSARAEQERVVALRAAVLPATDPQRADDLNDLAILCDRTGDDAAALDAWERSLALLRALPAAESAARAVPRLSAAAEAERRLGRHAACERRLLEAIALSEAHLPRDQRHARLLNNLGALQWDERRFDEASRNLREALRITREDASSSPLRVAVAHHNLANLKREQGEPDEAEALHREALALARAHLAEDPQFPVFLKEPAVLYAEQGRFDEAFALWDEALAALGAERAGLLGSEILYERARAELARGRPDAARAALEECLAIRMAKRTADHPMTAQARAALGTAAMRLGRDREARKHFEGALAVLRASPAYPEERAESLEGIARLDWRRGRREDAVAAMRQALDVLEGLRWHRTASERARADWARTAEEPARTMVAWLARLGRVAEALEFSERIRGRILGDQIAAAHVDWRRDVPADVQASLAAREREALATIATARRRLEAELRDDGVAPAAGTADALEAAARAYRDVLEEGRARSRAWRGAMGARSPEGIAAAVGAALGPGEIVLSWQIGDEASFLFELEAGAAPRCTELAVPSAVAKAWGVEAGALTGAKLAAALAAGHGPLPADGSGPRRDGLRGVGRATPAGARAGETAASAARLRDLALLGDALLPEPARRRALAADRVWVIPDGPLHDVPVEALAFAAKDGGAAYWLDLGPPVCYGASLATLLDLAARERSPTPGSYVLTVNDPDRGVTGDRPRQEAPGTLAEWAQAGRFHPLPGTRREGDALARAFGSGGVRRLVGADAREGEVKRLAPGARILHLGTHGVVEKERSDLLAALVLAAEPEGSAEDGFLHLFEVYDLRLAADLVVLSACETMQGARVPGEGVLALSRGFLAAGARRTVASLWPVHDEATSELMDAFVAELARGTAAAEALRDAKRSLRRKPDRADPFFWAPFVLGGSF